ncbi:N-acetylmuramoyl-L-alanine amidase [Pseudooceanicola sp. LIPI14-2-Ac024]|uniref:N-acetylmuramoyl-L-alanine amidase n=1 Tax=Pseudooceanicola sp. LIPI14-2-Ac024 TaxID=3344875 RepID=UPI0035D0F563
MGRQFFTFIGAVALAGCIAASAVAQGFNGLARIEPGASRIEDTGDALEVSLVLSQGVPWRIYTLDDPRRAVIDFREVDWTGVDKAALLHAGLATDVRFGSFRPGWSRMVIDLSAPLALDRAGLKLDAESGTARLTARFAPVDDEGFAALSGTPVDDGVWQPPAVTPPAPRQRDGLLVVIDPGHGGIDPGAEREGLTEKHLMLTFARELSEALIRAGVEVVMTRADDSFVSLERRVEIAHEVDADLFISLHADALSEGRARGAVVYALSETATDEASAKLAERHDRDDLLSGVDLTGKDDEVAGVLMDLARMETQPRTLRLAGALVKGMKAAGAPLNSHPHRSAGFSVLKAPDIPSVLIEVGFLSDERDRRNLADPAFRANFAAAIRDAVAAWRIEDAALARLVRQ